MLASSWSTASFSSLMSIDSGGTSFSADSASKGKVVSICAGLVSSNLNASSCFVEMERRLGSSQLVGSSGAVIQGHCRGAKDSKNVEDWSSEENDIGNVSPARFMVFVYSIRGQSRRETQNVGNHTIKNESIMAPGLKV